MPASCAIEGCEGKASSRGWCSAHYGSWARYGDPLIQRHARRGDPLRFLQEAAQRETDDCILWPFGRKASGYGVFHGDTEAKTAHRKMCEIAYGPPPTPAHQGAHSCNNRICVNPRHLRWALPIENIADQIAHGTRARGERNGFVKLTADAVKEIRRRHATGITGRALALEYGVTPTQLSRVVRREAWAWLD